MSVEQQAKQVSGQHGLWCPSVLNGHLAYCLNIFIPNSNLGVVNKVCLVVYLYVNRQIRDANFI